jgi:hypothetical protein
MSARKPTSAELATAKRTHTEEKMLKKDGRVTRSWMLVDYSSSAPNYVLPKSQFDQMCIFAR